MKPAILSGKGKLTIWAGAFVVLAGLGGLLILDLVMTYQVEFKFAQRDAENLAFVLDSHLKRSSQKIDIVLREAVNDYEPKLSSNPSISRLETNRDLLRRESVLDEVQPKSLRIVGPQGEVLYSASDTSDLPNVNVADREYFIEQTKNIENKLVISKPILSRFTGAWLITFSRRINNSDGSFAGLVQTAMRADSLQSVFQSLAVASHGAVTLFSSDFRLVARKPEMPEKLGVQFDLPEMRNAIESGNLNGSYQAISRVDGIESWPRLFGQIFR